MLTHIYVAIWLYNEIWHLPCCQCMDTCSYVCSIKYITLSYPIHYKNRVFGFQTIPTIFTFINRYEPSHTHNFLDNDVMLLLESKPSCRILEEYVYSNSGLHIHTRICPVWEWIRKWPDYWHLVCLLNSAAWFIIDVLTPRPGLNIILLFASDIVFEWMAEQTTFYQI